MKPSPTNVHGLMAPGPVMLDLGGLRLDHDDIRRIQHPLTGGVILFSRNYSDRQQLTALTQAIRSVRSDILIAVDHEGGRIQRFQNDGFTVLPAMGRLGALWDKDAITATRVATHVGYVLAAELRACGVDLSFTPVLDLDHQTSEIIGDRAFHHDATVVTVLAKNLNHGLALAGMSNCGKHFPGHGFAAADSHVAIPVDPRSLEEIIASDAAPYGWLGLGLAGVMPAHVIYPQVDSLPAGFSKKWLSLLRHRFGFDGVIFSDDLSMEGASTVGDVLTGARTALEAGCDMVLICNAPDKADILLAGLDPALAGWNHIGNRRIAGLIPHTVGFAWDVLQKEARYLAARRDIDQLA